MNTALFYSLLTELIIKPCSAVYPFCQWKPKVFVVVSLAVPDLLNLPSPSRTARELYLFSSDSV